MNRAHFTRSAPALLWAPMLLLGLGLDARAVDAQEPLEQPAAEAKRSHPSHTVAVTISPLHLLGKILELQAEFPIGPKFSVSGIAGYGRPTFQRKTVDGAVVSEHTASAIEVGAQGAYHLVGTVDHGMQLGAELLYVHLGLDDADFEGVSSSAGEGLAIGPFVGYKLVTGIGFALHVQLGFQYITLRAKATSTDGDVSSGERDGSVVLLNVGTGWAF